MKLIYSGNLRRFSPGNRGLIGPFQAEDFRKYMDKYEGAELVACYVKKPFGGDCLVYHIETQGLTVHLIEGGANKIYLELYGNPENMGEVEKKILDDNLKNYSKLRQSV